MSDVGDGLGTAIEGSLLARTVDGPKRRPKLGDDSLADARDGEDAAPPACLDCGTPLVGAHCHACGQKGHLHRTIGAFGHDILHGALHFDGRTWRTLPKLALRPGELTRRYIDGERTRFVSPMALFLFSIFLMFAVFQIAGISTPSTFNSASMIENNLDSALEELREERRVSSAVLAQTPPDDERYAQREQRLAEIERRLAEFSEARTVIVDLQNVGSRRHGHQSETGGDRRPQACGKNHSDPPVPFPCTLYMTSG